MRGVNADGRDNDNHTLRILPPLLDCFSTRIVRANANAVYICAGALQRYGRLLLRAQLRGKNSFFRRCARKRGLFIARRCTVSCGAVGIF